MNLIQLGKYSKAHTVSFSYTNPDGTVHRTHCGITITESTATVVSNENHPRAFGGLCKRCQRSLNRFSRSQPKPKVSLTFTHSPAKRAKQ